MFSGEIAILEHLLLESQRDSILQPGVARNEGAQDSCAKIIPYPERVEASEDTGCCNPFCEAPNSKGQAGRLPYVRFRDGGGGRFAMRGGTGIGFNPPAGGGGGWGGWRGG